MIAETECKPPRRTEEMALYCKSLSRYSSCLQTTELRLQNSRAHTVEDIQHRELLHTSRMNLVEDAWAHAKHCLAHCSQLRSHYGISASDQDVADDIPADANTGIANGVFDRLRLTTTELGRRLERLNEIESAFATWQGRADWWSKQLVVATTAVVGLSSMAAVATVGSRPLAPGMLAVLALLMLVVVACGLGIAVARRSPSVCVGPALARVPDASAMLRMAWRIAAPAAAGLAAARVVSGMV